MSGVVSTLYSPRYLLMLLIFNPEIAWNQTNMRTRLLGAILVLVQPHKKLMYHLQRVHARS